MTFLHLFILAVIQGMTEFLPVSSSGHLILLPALTGLQDQGQLIDVSVHVGTLCAVILFFWSDSRKAFRGLGHLTTRRANTEAARLALLLIVATLPVVLFGLILKLTGLSEHMRSLKVIGWTMLGFGLVLYYADQKGAVHKERSSWNLPDAIKLGLWQAIALIPGTSRSGAVITGTRLLGYNRSDGARIAMLMSIPTIIASGALLGTEALMTANARGLRDGAIAAVFSFLAALLALSLMMRLLRSVSFTPYVIYRVLLGMGLLWIAYN
ncbi:MAG: undecaprenyl-diphosphate phosphatase [Rhodobacteraceae bacterium]|nr:undecaprenyl-diphosphate phosphatase [Paracoccaceae bacterium]